MLLLVLGFIGIISIRIIEYVRFLKMLSQICLDYDWKYVSETENHHHLGKVISDSEYFKTETWSAFNFTFVNGPNLIKVFFKLDILKIETIYNKEILEKFKKYELI